MPKKSRPIKCKNCGSIFNSTQQNPKFCNQKCWMRFRERQIFGEVKLILKEKKKIWRKAFYQRHKKEENRKSRKWAIDNPERTRASSRKSYRKLGWKQKFSHLVQTARRKGVARELRASDYYKWYEKAKKKCVYCGISEEEIEKKGYKKGLTIDRKTPQKGYLLKNIVLACFRCNSIKGSWFTFEEMKDIAKTYKLKDKWTEKDKREPR